MSSEFDSLLDTIAGLAAANIAPSAARPLARIDLPALPLRARLVLAALVGQQPPDRRGGGALHRLAHVAALERSARLAGDRQGDPRARGAGAERARRRQPRAAGVL